MGTEPAQKKDRATVIFRPAPQREPASAGARLAGCALFLILAATLYAGAVAWLAHRERAQSEWRVRTIPSVALASFGARSEMRPGAPVGSVDAAIAGSEMRSILEERLKRLKGKSFSGTVATASTWEPLKADPKEGFVAVPPTTRVVDLHDPATCIALRAMHGTDFFLRVYAIFSDEVRKGPATVVRLEVSVFGKDARLVWTDIVTEAEEIGPWPAEASARDSIRMLKLRTAMFRAADRLGAALEYEGDAK
ncbi:MAG: hypothetical protein IT452_01600 [Planctomycetia bacterium]|nr:hypothetical protein [Planctomycetia bacterium]